jgi:hypothetical protein
MSRLDEIRARLEAARYFDPDPDQEMQLGPNTGRYVIWSDDNVSSAEESTAKFLCNAKSDIEYLLEALDNQGGIVVNSTLDVVSKGEGTGTSRYDWFGEAE